MSNALPSWQYKNPCDVLENKQEYERRKSCVGCKHSFALEFKSGIHNGCNQGKVFGKRCKLFDEKK